MSRRAASPPATQIDASTMAVRRLTLPLAHDFIHRGHRARRAALDRVAHQAGADRGDEECGTRQQDLHGSLAAEGAGERAGTGPSSPHARERRPGRTAESSLATIAGYIIGIIESGFLSLTMSAIVSTTTTLPSFFHQCMRPFDSRAISPALCRDRHRALAAVLEDLALVDHDQRRTVGMRMQRHDAAGLDLHVAVAQPALGQLDVFLREIDRRELHLGHADRCSGGAGKRIAAGLAFRAFSGEAPARRRRATTGLRRERTGSRERGSVSTSA